MKYFFDTEFIEDGQTIDLISIGMVAEDGREFYAVNKGFRLDRCHPWLWNNVLPYLPPHSDLAWMPKMHIRDSIKAFCDPQTYGRPEFWANYGAYDWVVFCQLFGPMIDLPPEYPRFCLDLQYLFEQEGRPTLHIQNPMKHNALEDARWNKKAYEALTSGAASPTEPSLDSGPQEPPSPTMR